MKPSKKDTRNLVSIKLLKRGFWVSTNPKNKKTFHIICSNADMTKRVGIRVSQSSTTSKTWLLKEKIEHFPDNMLYVLVGYKNLKSPDFFIVPIKVILDCTDMSNKKLRNTPKKDGNPHKDTHTRRFFIRTDDERKKYLNRWDLLGL